MQIKTLYCISTGNIHDIFIPWLIIIPPSFNFQLYFSPKITLHSIGSLPGLKDKEEIGSCATSAICCASLHRISNKQMQPSSPAVATTPERSREAMQHVAVALWPLNLLGSVMNLSLYLSLPLPLLPLLLSFLSLRVIMCCAVRCCFALAPPGYNWIRVRRCLPNNLPTMNRVFDLSSKSDLRAGNVGLLWDPVWPYKGFGLAACFLLIACLYSFWSNCGLLLLLLLLLYQLLSKLIYL